MSKDYTGDYIKESNRTDPSIASELAREALTDAKEMAVEAYSSVKEGVVTAVDSVSINANLAYEKPLDFLQATGRELQIMARKKPIETVLLFGALAFAIGSVWGIRR